MQKTSLYVNFSRVVADEAVKNKCKNDLKTQECAMDPDSGMADWTARNSCTSSQKYASWSAQRA